MRGVMPPNWVLAIKMSAFNAEGDRDHNDIGQLIWRYWQFISKKSYSFITPEEMWDENQHKFLWKNRQWTQLVVRMVTATISTNLLFELRHRMHSASIVTERWICYNCSETLTTTIYSVSNLAHEHNHTIQNYKFQFDRLGFTLYCCALHFYKDIFRFSFHVNVVFIVDLSCYIRISWPGTVWAIHL